MSYLDLGLGQVPAGRADPAACQRLVDAKEEYDALKAARACSPAAKALDLGDSCERLTDAYKEWQALRADRACRPGIRIVPPMAEEIVERIVAPTPMKWILPVGLGLAAVWGVSRLVGGRKK